MSILLLFGVGYYEYSDTFEVRYCGLRAFNVSLVGE